MSRSTRKNPILKHKNSISNKIERQRANKKLRRANHIILDVGEEYFKLLREVSDTYAFPSDGLAIYIADVEPKFLRK